MAVHPDFISWASVTPADPLALLLAGVTHPIPVYHCTIDPFAGPGQFWQERNPCEMPAWGKESSSDVRSL